MSPQKDFVGYEYQEITAPAGQVSVYLDCYENFGWQMDGNVPVFSGKRHATLRMKRDRKLIHKMELTRLQRHFEACAKEIEVLEKSKTSVASAWALVVGILGTAFDSSVHHFGHSRVHWVGLALFFAPAYCSQTGKEDSAHD